MSDEFKKEHEGCDARAFPCVGCGEMACTLCGEALYEDPEGKPVGARCEDCSWRYLNGFSR